ncbi:MAG: RNA polymerase sigma factor [Streptosporangiaceae bacterium]
MNDPHRDVSAATFPASHDPACDDAGLLGRIGQGDEEAMAAFYREHGRVVLAQVLLVAGERVLAEEIVQDTMLAVWRGAGSFRGESSVRSWVIAIARRQTRDRLRGRSGSSHQPAGRYWALPSAPGSASPRTDERRPC